MPSKCPRLRLHVPRVTSDDVDGPPLISKVFSLWTLAGVVAIEAMGGPKIPWYPGRLDLVDDAKCPPRGRLPDGTLAADHLRLVVSHISISLARFWGGMLIVVIIFISSIEWDLMIKK